MSKTPAFTRFVTLTLLLLLASISLAQDGVSTAGAARSRFLSGAGILPSPREVVVEDFVNYHRHEVARPKAGEAVGLDIRWGNTVILSSGEAVLQIGLSTALAHDSSELRPLNLSIVIDKSGSMADDNKLTRVKEALTTLVSKLHVSDVLSIVVFDSEAEVILPAERVTDKEQIISLIQEIQPGSTTNLHAGLMLGYEEALKHYRKDATNRVILLTDGIANRGVTDPSIIAQASLAYNDQGIDLSTIGVGLDLNRGLLQQLAKSGRGLFHFIADSEDIQKVFAKEMQSLVSPVATEPNLEINFPAGLELQQVYGYQPRVGHGSVKIKLDNLNSGATEVVLLRFKSMKGSSNEIQFPVKVRLKYYDLDRKSEAETEQDTSIVDAHARRRFEFEDDSVAKNFTIAQLAQSIHDMAADWQNNRHGQAEQELSAAISEAKERYPRMEDEDIKRTLQIAEKYRKVLRQLSTGIESDEPVRDGGL